MASTAEKVPAALPVTAPPELAAAAAAAAPASPGTATASPVNRPTSLAQARSSPSAETPEPDGWSVQTGPAPSAVPLPTAAAWSWPGLRWQLLALLKTRLHWMLVSLLTAWLLHTYLIVVKNEGFSGFGHWSAPYLNVQGNAMGAFLSFGLGSGMLWSLLLSWWRQGLVSTLHLVLGAPARCLSGLRPRDPSGWPGLALGAALVLLGCRFFNVPVAARLPLAAASLLWSTTWAGTAIQSLMLPWFARVGERYRSMQGLNLAALAGGLITAVPPAFTLSWLFAYNLADKLGWLALAYLLYCLYQRARPGTRAAATLICLSALWLVFSNSGWADDGGWVEATGGGGLTPDNLVRWWTSVGSGAAIGQGLVPAAAAALGAGLAPPLKPGEDPDRIIGYVLHLSADDFVLEIEQPHSLSVSVWAVTAAGARLPAANADIQIVSNNEEVLVTPGSGVGSLEATLKWTGGEAKTARLSVNASAGGTRHSAPVRLTMAAGFELEVTVTSYF